MFFELNNLEVVDVYSFKYFMTGDKIVEKFRGKDMHLKTAQK